ncbi:hypothetical protein MJO28_005330 [Puccinia striiformis f. sp. tritici]|uniref:Uncharacterized protein n=1 Tax=Puccinia striiformis f. sp. tritici TaxID=168172 RepID=A0ACC0EKW8_9BASI|nr:hypothetical protein MJO28_005330 [Puccinia striiformis f. sp. tritici]
MQGHSKIQSPGMGFARLLTIMVTVILLSRVDQIVGPHISNILSLHGKAHVAALGKGHKAASNEGYRAVSHDEAYTPVPSKTDTPAPGKADTPVPGEAVTPVPAKATTAAPVKVQTAVPVYSTCTVPGSMSLTFDDGPFGYSSKLDATLNAANTKGTFFINGNNWGCIYDYADALLDRFNKGHLIGSHTWSHVHLNEGTYAQISHQLELVEQAMIKILGVKPLYMRPPYGEYNDVVLKVLGDRGYKGLFMWNQDSGDTFTPTPSPAEIIERYRSFPAGSNILNHEVKDFTVEQVIPAVIPMLQKKGFSLMTSTECLGLSSNPKDWYVQVQKPGVRDASWTCASSPLPAR